MDHAREVPAAAGVGDAEVPEKAKRRRFDAAYKLRILEEADRSTGPGELGELLRREGLYSSHLTCWRRQRDEGSLAGLAPKRRLSHWAGFRECVKGLLPEWSRSPKTVTLQNPSDSREY